MASFEVAAWNNLEKLWITLFAFLSTWCKLLVEKEQNMMSNHSRRNNLTNFFSKICETQGIITNQIRKTYDWLRWWISISVSFIEPILTSYLEPTSLVFILASFEVATWTLVRNVELQPQGPNQTADICCCRLYWRDSVKVCWQAPYGRGFHKNWGPTRR